jgi:hypothetical protein
MSTAMNPVLVSCQGFSMGSAVIPPFEVCRGDFLCLHPPWLTWSQEEDQFIHLLTQGRQELGLHLFGRVVWAARPTGLGRWRALFQRQSIVKWIRQHAGISDAAAGALLDRLGVRGNPQVVELPWDIRARISLETAYLCAADVVVFGTSGLGPLTINRLYETVSSRLDRAAAIHLSYLPIGQRHCFAGGRCLEFRSHSSAALGA